MNPPFYQISSLEKHHEMSKLAINNPADYWESIAREFEWRKPWEKVIENDMITPKISWFTGGKLNITENCIDRHLKSHPDKKAIIWEPNDPEDEIKTYTYQQLYEEVNRFSNILKKCGIHKGDRVCIYLPMIPEATFAMLACARLGAIHSVVFAGFSAQALADRVNDASAKMIITADGLVRGAKKLLLKNIVEESMKQCACVDTILTIKHTGDLVKSNPKDVWYHDLISEVNTEFQACEMDAEDELFILYTSGSTGKPKGVVHSCGGYMVYADYSFRNVFQYKGDDVFWCTADVGWITGHTYITYGPLLAGATCLMFEGIPTYPNAERFWKVIEKHEVNQFYTAPTAIRALMACGENLPEKYALASLKVIGSVGEPINEEAWKWYYQKIGKQKAALVDTWWQTETGGIMISNLGKVGQHKPTYAGLPLPGIQACLMTAEGEEIENNNQEGLLAIKFPWPSMIRTTWGDHQRCKEVYFSAFKGLYFTGDGAKRDENGLYRIIGRVDDVINVSGHRIGTAEVENAINAQDKVIESAVVGYPHEIKGQGIYAFVICDAGAEQNNELRNAINAEITKQIGPIAKADQIQFVSGLPKTRSGKIMRRILRKIAENRHDELGDTSTLLDPSVVSAIIDGRVS